MNTMLRFCLAVLVVGLLGTPVAGAAQSDKVTHTLQRAENGDAAAANSLGVWYEKGKNGMPKDAAQAVYWYTVAAQKGNALALHNLGDCYRSGVGVQPDPIKAYEYYLNAAQRGLPLGYEDVGDSIRARTNLDSLLVLGDAEWNHVAALWYKKAAEHGRPTAQAKLQTLLSGLARDGVRLPPQDTSPLPVCLTEELAPQGITGTWLRRASGYSYDFYVIKTNDGRTIEVVMGDGVIPGFENVDKGDTVQINYTPVRELDPYSAECRIFNYYKSGGIVGRR